MKRSVVDGGLVAERRTPTGVRGLKLRVRRKEVRGVWQVAPLRGCAG